VKPIIRIANLRFNTHIPSFQLLRGGERGLNRVIAAIGPRRASPPEPSIGGNGPGQDATAQRNAAVARLASAGR